MRRVWSKIQVCFAFYLVSIYMQVTAETIPSVTNNWQKTLANKSQTILYSTQNLPMTSYLVLKIWPFCGPGYWGGFLGASRPMLFCVTLCPKIVKILAVKGLNYQKVWKLWKKSQFKESKKNSIEQHGFICRGGRVKTTTLEFYIPCDVLCAVLV